MPIEEITKTERQSRLMQDKMSNELNPKNKIYRLRAAINWQRLETRVKGLVEVSDLGRNRKDIRVMLGVVLLQAMYNLSDNQASEMFSENNYWQHFCGYEYFQRESMVSEATIRRFRNILGEEGHLLILEELQQAAMETGLLKKKT